MDVEKAIEILSDFCDRHIVTLDEDFYEAVRMGKRVLILLSTEKAIRWDEGTQQLLLNTERRQYEPDPRD